MRRIEVEQLYSVSLDSLAEPGTTHREFSGLIRDASGTVWAVGTNIVLSTCDGVNWYSFTKGLTTIVGSFAVDNLVCYRAQKYLVLRAEGSFHIWRLNELERQWQHVAELPVAFPARIAAAAVDTEGIVVLSEEGTEVFVYRSENGWSWEKSRTDLRNSPMYLQLSSSGHGFSCFQHSCIGTDFVAGEGSSVYVTTNSGRNWRLVTWLDTSLLRVASVSHKKMLLGGTEGFLGVCDFDHCERQLGVFPNMEVVGLDSYRGTAIAILETEACPSTQRVFVSSNRRNWAEYRLDIDERVSAARFVAESRFALCTGNSLYTCSFT